MNKTEIQLFLLWGNARKKENEIISEISKNFEIIEIYEIHWDKKLFKSNLERFYCEKIRSKIKHTGTDSFLLITFRDFSPIYEYRHTLKGYEVVNSKILTLKQQFRKLTGGGYKIHSTNDINEVNNNLVFLINKSYDDYFKESEGKVWKPENSYIQITEQPKGTYGWNSFDEILYVLNSASKYVILRNFDKEDRDIDILVNDFRRIKYLLNGKFIKTNKYKSKLQIQCEGKNFILDLRYIGDNYYCEKWEEDILNNRIFKDGYFAPNEIDLFYSLIYHVEFHKTQSSHKYDELLKSLAQKYIKDENLQFTHEFYLKKLNEFMNKEDYYPIRPSDRKVKYNLTNIRRMFYICTLEKYGIEVLKTLAINKKPTSGFDAFFLAKYNNQKVFVKFGNGSYDAKKEYCVYSALRAQDEKHIPKPLMYKNLADNKMFIMTEFIDGSTLDKISLDNFSSEKLNIIFDSLIEIGELLFKNRFIHRDFHRGNLIVEDNGNVKLIDMQHLIGYGFPENSENLKRTKRLRGTNKRLRPAPYVWDDMYSLYKILQTFPREEIIGYDKKLEQVKSKVGKLRNHFLDNKFSFETYRNHKIFILYKLANSITRPFRKLFKL